MNSHNPANSRRGLWYHKHIRPTLDVQRQVGLGKSLIGVCETAERTHTPTRPAKAAMMLQGGYRKENRPGKPGLFSFVILNLWK